MYMPSCDRSSEVDAMRRIDEDDLKRELPDGERLLELLVAGTLDGIGVSDRARVRTHDDALGVEIRLGVGEIGQHDTQQLVARHVLGELADREQMHEQHRQQESIEAAERRTASCFGSVSRDEQRRANAVEVALVRPDLEQLQAIDQRPMRGELVLHDGVMELERHVLQEGVVVDGRRRERVGLRLRRVLGHAHVVLGWKQACQREGRRSERRDDTNGKAIVVARFRGYELDR